MQPSPVIHQGVTVQLLVLSPCSGQLPLCISAPVTLLQSAWNFLITSGGGRARLCLGQLFIFQAGVRNVECYNLGQRVVGNWTGSQVSGSCTSFARAFGGSQLCLALQFLHQSWLNWPIVFLQLLACAWP